MNYNEFYNNKIYDNGICPHLRTCNAKELKYGHICYKAKIGKDYNNSHPKVLFVGKESPGESASVKYPEKIENVRKNNRHYLGLYYTAVLLFTDKIPKDTKQDTLKEFSGLEEKYCLTNYFKCAFKEENNSENIHGVKTNSEMKKHCPELLVKEIEYLKPDLVIIQGKFTGKFFWDDKTGALYRITTEGRMIYSKKDSGITLYRYEYKDTKKPLFILWGYHPASSDFYKKGDINNLEILNEAINKFKKEFYSI